MSKRYDQFKQELRLDVARFFLNEQLRLTAVGYENLFSPPGHVVIGRVRIIGALYSMGLSHGEDPSLMGIFPSTTQPRNWITYSKSHVMSGQYVVLGINLDTGAVSLELIDTWQDQ